MELEREQGIGLAIRSYQAGCIIETDAGSYSSSLIITPKQVMPWRPMKLSDLTAADLYTLLDFTPKIILLGTGQSLQFPPIELWRDVIEKNIGYEIMDTAAACRTYNVLMSENRAVVAGLLIR